MRKWIASAIGELGLMALVAFGAWEAGSQNAHSRDAAALATYRDNAAATAAALTDLQHQLDDQAKSLATARQIAARALDQRDAAQRARDALIAARKANFAKATHENADCAALTRPLCPAAAERLFGQPAGGAAAAH